MLTNATLNDVKKAIETINQKHGYKIILKDYSQISKNRLRFTIRSERSKIHGASISASGRNSVAASWYAHGYLFQELIDAGYWIKTARQKIESHLDNWQDYNVGSLFNPIYASDCSY